MNYLCWSWHFNKSPSYTRRRETHTTSTVTATLMELLLFIDPLWTTSGLLLSLDKQHYTSRDHETRKRNDPPHFIRWLQQANSNNSVGRGCIKTPYDGWGNVSLGLPIIREEGSYGTSNKEHWTIRTASELKEIVTACQIVSLLQRHNTHQQWACYNGATPHTVSLLRNGIRFLMNSLLDGKSLGETGQSTGRISSQATRCWGELDTCMRWNSDSILKRISWNGSPEPLRREKDTKFACTRPLFSMPAGHLTPLGTSATRGGG